MTAKEYIQEHGISVTKRPVYLNVLPVTSQNIDAINNRLPPGQSVIVGQAICLDVEGNIRFGSLASVKSNYARADEADI